MKKIMVLMAIVSNLSAFTLDALQCSLAKDGSVSQENLKKLAGEVLHEALDNKRNCANISILV